ncbi:hypothetical protein [Paraburkholderia tropica]|uniref:hypothetical protein n=1 Tax=Paraburkholderia tropica TaxID=92647 RepID=UPI002AB1B37B|nr:hypothetical protein [Paraburkholderia tropica]
MKKETSQNGDGEFGIAISPPVASREQLTMLLDLQSRVWPMGLTRFTPFKRARDPESVRYRAICWHAYTQTLIVLRANPLVTPDGVGEWVHWSLQTDADALNDIQITSDNLTPLELRRPLQNLRPSSVTGMVKREKMLRAVLYVAPYEGAKQHEWVFNDAYFYDDEVRIATLNRVCTQLGKARGFQTQLREYVHKFVMFGGIPNALARLTFRRGGPGEKRVGKNRLRPGRRTSIERRDAAREAATGIRARRARQLPLRRQDEPKILDSLRRIYGMARKSIIDAYRDCLRVHYRKWPLHLVPTERMFRVCAKRLIKEHDVENLRLRHTLSAQHNTARSGTASDLTQGVIDIVDVDGFRAKVGIAAAVNEKIESVHVVVLFAVSRLSGAVLGWELRIDQEKGEAFRRCIASVFMSKKRRAHELGLSSAKGLLHGNIDGVFVDNGAGASKETIASAVDEMGLLHTIAPPARGDFKGVGEGLNSIMVRLLLVLRSAYTRETDHVAKAHARQAAIAKPVPLLVFERLLLQAIAYYNRYTNKRRLRTAEMRKRRVKITPEALHRWTQRQRFGDARKILPEWQVYDRFVTWKPRVCRDGKVVFMDRRFSAPELKTFFNEHRKARRPGSCSVEVKRLNGPANILKWRTPDGTIVDLEMIPEDQWNTGDVVTWMEVELQNMDDSPQSGTQSQKLKRRANAHRLTVAEDESVSKTEGNRALLGGLQGSSVAEAKDNARKQREKADRQREAQAYGLTSYESAPPALETPVIPLPAESSAEEEDFYRSLGL